MLNTEVFFSIVAVYIMIVVSPGPNFMLVSRYSLRGNLRGAVGLMLGFALGATINACLTMFGVGALIVAVPAIGFVVSLLGGGFLAYLGLSAIVVAVRERRMAKENNPVVSPDISEVHGAASGENRLLSGIQKGSIVNLLNPKGIMFFIGLYAPLIAKSTLTTKLAVLVAGFMIEIIWYCLVIFVLSRPRFRSAYERASFGVDVVLGFVLTLVGLRIMMEAGSYMGSAG